MGIGWLAASKHTLSTITGTSFGFFCLPQIQHGWPILSSLILKPVGKAETNSACLYGVVNAVVNAVFYGGVKPLWCCFICDLLQVNALLPTETFIPVIRGLMTNQLPSVRRKAMDLLNNKVQQRTRWQKSQVRLSH